MNGTALIEHPRVLMLAALLCLPALFPLARFFFDDFASFRREAGIEMDRTNFWLSLLGGIRPGMLQYRAIAFLGCYGLLALGVYQLLLKIGGLLAP